MFSNTFDKVSRSKANEPGSKSRKVEAEKSRENNISFCFIQKFLCQGFIRSSIERTDQRSEPVRQRITEDNDAARNGETVCPVWRHNYFADLVR